MGKCCDVVTELRAEIELRDGARGEGLGGVEAVCWKRR